MEPKTRQSGQWTDESTAPAFAIMGSRAERQEQEHISFAGYDLWNMVPAPLADRLPLPDVLAPNLISHLTDQEHSQDGEHRAEKREDRVRQADRTFLLRRIQAEL